MILLKPYFLYANKKGWIVEENGKYYLMPGGPIEIEIYEDPKTKTRPQARKTRR